MDFLEQELLLAEATGKTREYLLAHPEYRLGLLAKLKYRYLLKARERGVPLSYLTKSKEFFGLDFYVDRRVLIPRPDTELTVETALKEIRLNHNEAITLVDIGTGSGAIPVAVLKSLAPNRIDAYATDISGPALKVAAKNARTHKVFVNFLQGDLLHPVITHGQLPKDQLLLLTANLPYGWKAWKNNTRADTLGLKFEPAIALFTEEKGLFLIKKLLLQLKELPQKKIIALLEFDPRQSEMLRILTEAILPEASFEILKDLSGFDRLLKLNLAR